MRSAAITADQRRDFGRQRMLRPDFVAGVELLAHGVLHELGLPAEHVHAEAVERVDVLVAVEVPHLRALGALDDDLVGDLLGDGPEAVDHARVGHVSAIGFGELLALLRAFHVAAHEGGQARLLAAAGLAGALGVDAGDGAKGLLHVVAHGLGRRVRGVGRCRSGRGPGVFDRCDRCERCERFGRFSRCSGRPRHCRLGRGLGLHLLQGHQRRGLGSARQQCELLAHQFHLLRNQLVQWRTA
jgi:hypothetical protein